MITHRLLHSVAEISQWRALLPVLCKNLFGVNWLSVRVEDGSSLKSYGVFEGELCDHLEEVITLADKADFVLELKKGIKVYWWLSRVEEDSESLLELEAFLKLLSSRCEFTKKISRVSHDAWERLAKQAPLKDIVAESEAMKRILERSRLVAPFDTAVLLQGESGTGKDVIAHYLHDKSNRRKKSFVAINCASLPSNLIESTLFGHEKGAFTGAEFQKKGYFERASGGTLFLDEIAELSLAAQAKVLRVLENGEYERVGGHETLKSNVRIVAASHKNLKSNVENSLFRQDLYYRLSTFTIKIPPLRERKEDLIPLATFFVQQLSANLKIEVKKLSSKFHQELLIYNWPGNARELRNEIEKGLILSQGKSFKLYIDDTSDGVEELHSFDAEIKRVIENALTQSNGKVQGHGGAAERLALKPQTLYSKMRKYGIASS